MNRVQLGIKLKDARNATRLTQEQLAERYRLDPKKISRIERGVQFPEQEYLDMLERISPNFNVQDILSTIREIQAIENKSAYQVNDSISNQMLMDEIKKLQQMVVSLTQSEEQNAKT